MYKNEPIEIVLQKCRGRLLQIQYAYRINARPMIEKKPVQNFAGDSSKLGSHTATLAIFSPIAQQIALRKRRPGTNMVA